MRRLKQALLILVAIGTLLYVMWGVVLAAVLPDASGGLKPLAMIGLFSMLLGTAVFLGLGIVGFLRVKASKAPVRARQFALLKSLGLALTGTVFSLTVAFLISREPALGIDILSPARAEDFVAPLPVTFSVERAVQTLEARGFRAIEYAWDLRGDGKLIEKTVVPTLTATFDREGIYPLAVRITAADGSTRSASRRLIIQRSVFAVSPNPPVIDQPVALSLTNLLADPKLLQEASWDLDGDGKEDEKTKSPQISTTYRQLGPVTISVTVKLSNKTQATYERTIEVIEPPPLPFPVTLSTEPKKLVGSPPFGVLFTLETEEPVTTIQWNFGDGTRGDGARVAHTFPAKGTFPVTARVRSQSGETAELTAIVRVIDPLQLSDLTFDGSPKVTGNKISGELPLKLMLTPKTRVPFVQFSWEVPEDNAEVASTEGTLNAIYREPGTYTITLVGEDADQHVLRMPISVEVKPASSFLSFAMDPEAGTAPLTIKLDATETVIPDKTITGFQWDFGDRSEPEFGAARTEHTYTKAGTYTVQLAVRTTDGKEYITTKTIVVQPPILEPCILPSRTEGNAPLGVKFSMECSVGNFESWLWDFGDGAQSDAQSPIHVFDEPGEYTVTLTFTDAEGEEQTASVDISVFEP